MPLNSRGHRRARDQGPVVKKRDPLVCDRDDDLERALRRGFGPGVPGRFRVCLPVVVPVFERSVMAWPERVPGPKPELSVCAPCREHENGECRHCHRAYGADVDASEAGCRHAAITTQLGVRRNAVLAIPVRTSRGTMGAICRLGTMPAKPAPNASFRSHATAHRKYPSHSAPTPANPGDRRACPAETLAGFPSDFGRAEACTDHSSKDFESIAWPSYQHFLPSIRRQDQYPCACDGLATLHFCFASALGISIDESVAMQAAKAMNGVLLPHSVPHAVKLHARPKLNCDVASEVSL